MRKYILAALLTMAALPSFAGNRERKSSPYKYEINVAWGYGPAFVMNGLHDYISTTVNDSGLDHIYGNYISGRKTTGLMSADFNIQFKKWFALGVQFNAVAVSNTEASSITGAAVDKFTDYALSLVPYARLTYLNREYAKVYTSVGFGISYNRDEVPENYYRGPENYIWPRFQLVPVGVMVGKRVYGMAEFGAGTEFMGVRVGIGYRF